MCSKANIKVFLLGLNTLIMVSAVAMVLMFFVLLFNSQWTTAYGGVVYGWAVGMLLGGILLATVGCMSFYGAANHNKFMLVMASCVAMLVVMIQASVATNIQSVTEPAFPDALVDGCLKAGDDTLANTPECQEYFSHETTIRHFQAWLAFYQESQDDELVKQDLVAIESNNYCCGFGPAAQCTGEPTDDVVVVTDAMVESETPFDYIKARCFSEVAGWYAPQRHCKRETPPTLKRGCPYMYSASTACVRDETIRSGCAKVYAAQIQGSISPIATIGLMLISLQVLVCVGSTCMCLKRKDHDVLPPPEAFVDKRFEKYRFDVEEPAIEAKATKPTT